MNLIIQEFAHNMTGYFLVLAGVVVIAIGAHYHIYKEIEIGASLAGAALLAFQSKPKETGK